MKKTPFLREIKKNCLISSKTIKIMKLSVFLFLFSLIQLWASDSYSQHARLTLDLKDVTVEEALSKIEQQSEFFFLYSSKMIDVKRKVDVELQEKKITDALDQIFANTDVQYVVSNRQIVLSTEEQISSLSGKTSETQQMQTISGKVTDENGESLPGVSIYIKGSTQGTISNADGTFSLQIPAGANTLIFTFVGMKEQEVEIAGRNTVDVTMQQDVISLDEVVTIGYGTSLRKDLTGAVSTVKTAD
jgi:hypothetical protein